MASATGIRAFLRRSERLRRLVHRLRGDSHGVGDPFVGRAVEPWRWHERFDRLDRSRSARFCNLCWWSGEAFEGFDHSESAVCPACGSVARDRFLFLCFVDRQPAGRYRVLETSPRLGEPYREAMRRWFYYRASDFDQRVHRADIELDLQDIHLDAGSIDILLTPHVLEHVPDTDRALAQIHRLLAPGGAMYLQVPVLQGATARPAVPEFHGDNTPVEWRFGPDLTERLRGHGFEVSLLCTEDLRRRVADGERAWPSPASPEFDVGSILESLCYADLESVAPPDVARGLGLEPSFMFLTWECKKLDQTPPTR